MLLHVNYGVTVTDFHHTIIDNNIIIIVTSKEHFKNTYNFILFIKSQIYL